METATYTVNAILPDSLLWMVCRRHIPRFNAGPNQEMGRGRGGVTIRQATGAWRPDTV
jgi:hypothetical protein